MRRFKLAATHTAAQNSQQYGANRNKTSGPTSKGPVDKPESCCVGSCDGVFCRRVTRHFLYERSVRSQFSKSENQDLTQQIELYQQAPRDVTTKTKVDSTGGKG